MLPVTPPKLGRYEIVDEIGKGAMGVVYLARDPLIGRLVALKTFRIGYSVRDHELEQFRVRFMREAQSAGILSHPHIVTIHDVVEQTEEGLAFIAMEYVRGTNLKSLLQGDPPMSFNFVVDIMGQIAEALDYAHAHRVIHRDVKPANILITADNKVKITDFGIARLDTSNLTQEGQLLGTPNYMAPEQIQGKEIDHRADLFALGVVLYEMLTRHKPFQGENLTVVSHRIVYDHFTPPKDYAKDLPPGVERILDRALEKDPARRYQRAKDLADDLRRVLAESSRDDLNETLSIATWAPATEPASPPPPPGGGTTASTPSAGAAPVPVAMPAIPAKPVKAAKPKAPRPPVSPRRLAISAGVAALVTILIGAALLLGISWTGAGARIDAAADAKSAQYMDLKKQGQVHMRTAHFAEAVMAFQQARQIAPENEKQSISLLVQAAEDQLADFMKSLSLTEQVAAFSANATAALEDGRFTDAIEAANAVLAVDPDNAEALRIRTEAEKGNARLHRRRQIAAQPQTPGEQIVSSTPQQVEPSPVQEQATAVVGQAKLRISLHSEMLGTSVRIDLKNDTILRRNYRGKRTGIFRKAEPFSAEETIELPTGVNDLQVLVVPAGMAGKTVRRSGNFPGGETRSLNIRVSKNGAISVDLM